MVVSDFYNRSLCGGFTVRAIEGILTLLDIFRLMDCILGLRQVLQWAQLFWYYNLVIIVENFRLLEYRITEKFIEEQKNNIIFSYIKKYVNIKK